MASVFTRIMQGELPGEIVYQDDQVVALLDIAPKSEGHTLVVPRQEVAAFHDLAPETAAALARALQVVTRGVLAATGTPHYNLALNTGAPAGQVVFHVHFHIIPRHEGQPRGRLGAYAPGRMAEVAHAIRTAIRATIPPAQK